MSTTIYPARKVITMNPANPVAEAVAVKDGRILGAGSVDELAQWGPHEIDNTFADKVIVPGFVEVHCHAGGGTVWENPYIGFYDRPDPDGVVWEGCKSVDEVLDRLRRIDQEMTDAGEPDDALLLAWGLDPLFLPGDRLYAEHLDQVSTVRPIYIAHVSGHLATVNTALMVKENITVDTPTPGVAKYGADHAQAGQPNGELHEPAAMRLAGEAMERMTALRVSATGIRNWARIARNVGHTTITDLATGPLDDESVALWEEVVNDEAFPARVVRAASLPFGGPTADPKELAEVAAARHRNSTDKLHYGIVKLFFDGSIQGFTARVSWPYYYRLPEGNPENGIWLTAPDAMPDILEAYHRHGLTVHCHCNGDQATEAWLDAVETVLERHPRWDHRHTVQHCQMTTKAQYRRMAGLGMCANIFANHIFFWGDQHRDMTLGPERARGMDACATALREGVPFSIHSDDPVTPLGHLHTMWCAVNRVTASGDVLGEDERIPVEAALHAATLGAAYQIKRDDEIGSIETGKLADFAILEDDPLSVDPMTLKDIGVWGTVVGGVHYQAGQ